jgi:hypothetical protein
MPPMLTGRGLSCWKSKGEYGYYVRYSALFEKLVSFWCNVYKKNSAVVVANIANTMTFSGDTANRADEYIRNLMEITPETIVDTEKFGHILTSLETLITNRHGKNGNLFRHIIAAIFCRLKHAKSKVISSPPAYIGMYGRSRNSDALIAALVEVGVSDNPIANTFCKSNITDAQYQTQLQVAKGLLSNPAGLAALPVLSKILDLAFEISPVG